MGFPQVYGFAKKPIGKGGIYHMAPIYRGKKIAEDKILLFFDYDPTIDDVRAGKTYKRLPIMDRAREFRGFLIAMKNASSDTTNGAGNVKSKKPAAPCGNSEQSSSTSPE